MRFKQIENNLLAVRDTRNGINYQLASRKDAIDLVHLLNNLEQELQDAKRPPDEQSVQT